MADTAAAPVFKKRNNKTNIRKRAATPPPADSESEYTSSEENGVRIKRRRTEGVMTTQSAARAADLSKSSAFAADRSTKISANGDATKASTWFTDAALAAGDAPVKEVQAKQEGVYGGTAQYGSFIQKNPDARKLGPQKAPTNVRTITVTDFAPDVCKDYKQTGFCGFGDSCKFLHAREDYKQGWQLDKEWEKVGSKKDKKDGGKEDEGLDEEEKMLRDIPFKCVICKEDYKTPVVTKCGHYFCEKCAMDRYMKGKKKTCAACGADTGGSFGVARKLRALLEKKRKREKEKEAEAEDG